jgi:hypothetical protein
MASKNRKSTYQNKPTWPNNSFLCQSHRCAVYNAASLNTNSLTCKCWHQLLLWHLESSSWTQLCAVNSTVWTQNKLFFITLHPFWWNMISQCFHPFLYLTHSTRWNLLLFLSLHVCLVQLYFTDTSPFSFISHRYGNWEKEIKWNLRQKTKGIK